jgi:hypothetical protein
VRIEITQVASESRQPIAATMKIFKCRHQSVQGAQSLQAFEIPAALKRKASEKRLQ